MCACPVRERIGIDQSLPDRRDDARRSGIVIVIRRLAVRLMSRALTLHYRNNFAVEHWSVALTITNALTNSACLVVRWVLFLLARRKVMNRVRHAHPPYRNPKEKPSMETHQSSSTKQ